jgi:putative ABC transport system permease protein
MWCALRLSILLAFRSMRHHRIVAVATVLGVAIGMTVVCAILIVDNNTRDVILDPPDPVADTADRNGFPGSVLRIPGISTALKIDGITFERARDRQNEGSGSVVPSQRGGAGSVGARTLANQGKEDYAAMRLAVRLASLLSFLVGAVIVFYTMRFSVAARAREFCLLLCLGESRRGVAASLLTEATILGVAGTAIGLMCAIPTGRLLLRLGISTTGQMPVGTAAIPWGELAAMSLISIAVAILGVASPVRTIFRMEIARILQPRFLSEDARSMAATASGFLWLLPAALLAAYVLVRPFLVSWMSVVHFFLFEAVFVTVIAAATLWWVSPLLRGSIRLFEGAMRPVMPLEALLTGRRMRLATRQITFAITAVVLVFSMLTALHAITRALKDEIVDWSTKTLAPYTFFERTSVPFDEVDFTRLKRRHGVEFVRMSAKIPGAFPIRLVKGQDINIVRLNAGRPLLMPGTVILSKTLAARFDTMQGDALIIRSEGHDYHFDIIEVADDTGYFAEDGRYVDLKSYAVFSDGNRLFADNLERTLGLFGAARYSDGKYWLWRPLRNDALYPYYLRTHRGHGLVRGYSRTREIDRDFLIFDFILAMTVLLAAIGVANTLLIQVHSRGREFSVLRTVGMGRLQITKMLLAEGAIIGLVGALLAAVVGNILGAVSISFLDHFTLFDYQIRLSWQATLVFSLVCFGTCLIAAIYPAFVAIRMSSAESLHYE